MSWTSICQSLLVPFRVTVRLFGTSTNTFRRKWSIFFLYVFFTAKWNQFRYRSKRENLDRGQYRFQPIKFVNSVVPSPCETAALKYYALLVFIFASIPRIRNLVIYFAFPCCQMFLRAKPENRCTSKRYVSFWHPEVNKGRSYYHKNIVKKYFRKQSLSNREIFFKVNFLVWNCVVVALC